MEFHLCLRQVYHEIFVVEFDLISGQRYLSALALVDSEEMRRIWILNWNRGVLSVSVRMGKGEPLVPRGYV